MMYAVAIAVEDCEGVAKAHSFAVTEAHSHEEAIGKALWDNTEINIADVMSIDVTQAIPTWDFKNLTEEIKHMWTGDNKIKCIKRVRELTGMGLKDSKTFVEGVQFQLYQGCEGY